MVLRRPRIAGDVRARGVDRLEGFGQRAAGHLAGLRTAGHTALQRESAVRDLGRGKVMKRNHRGKTIST